MTHLLTRLLVGALLAVAFAAPSVAHEIKIGSLEITNLWARATPPGAPTGAGYMTITNHGSEADTLTAVSTPAAGTGELHIMDVKNGIMTMRPVEGGIVIPPGGTVTLAPGGLHLMFVTLKEPFVDGGKLPVTLTFAKAGTVETFLHIMPVGSKGPTGSGDAMNMNGDTPNTGNGQMGQGK